jgi:hypothetical protein
VWWSGWVRGEKRWCPISKSDGAPFQKAMVPHFKKRWCPISKIDGAPFQKAMVLHFNTSFRGHIDGHIDDHLCFEMLIHHTCDQKNPRTKIQHQCHALRDHNSHVSSVSHISHTSHSRLHHLRMRRNHRSLMTVSMN